MLSQYLNHPCNLYLVNKKFNRDIGNLDLAAFSNSEYRDNLIQRYVVCNAQRKQITKDETMCDSQGMVYDTVTSHVQYLLKKKMEGATG